MDELHPVGNRILFENEHIRAWLIGVAPRDTFPMHHHLLPYLLVNLTDGDLSVDTPDGDPLRRALRAGTVEWHDSGETHMFVNQGPERYQNVLVEVKAAGATLRRA